MFRRAQERQAIRSRVSHAELAAYGRSSLIATADAIKNHNWLCSFKRASFFVRFEWPFLRPGLRTEGRCAQGLSRRAFRPPRSGLVLMAPSTAPCLRRTGHSQLRRRFPGLWKIGEAPEPNFALANGHGIYRDPLGLKWPRPQSREQRNCISNQKLSPGRAITGKARRCLFHPTDLVSENTSVWNPLASWRFSRP